MEALLRLGKRNNQDINNYFYYPSFAGAIISCLIFTFISMTLSWQLRRHRIRYPMILPIGAGCEALGYIFRALSASGGRETNFALFLLMDMFIILSPLAFMAGLYVIYGRLVRRLTVSDPAPMCMIQEAEDEPHVAVEQARVTRAGRFSPLPARWYARTFITCDITSFLVQAGGAGLIVSSDPHTANLGKSILMAGLAFGFATFAIFIFLMVYTNVLVSRHIKAGTFLGRGLSQNWRRIMVPLFLASACILARTVYRIIEFAGGYSGHIYTTEWYLYVFDTTLMVICIAVWVPFFPAKYGLTQSLDGRDATVEQEKSISDTSGSESSGSQKTIGDSKQSEVVQVV